MYRPRGKHSLENPWNPSCSDSQAFAAIAARLAQARFHDGGRNPGYSRENCELSAQSVSYILRRRFGIQRDLPDLTGMANRCQGWKAEDRLAFLKEIQGMSRQTGGSIKKTIAPPPRKAPPETETKGSPTILNTRLL